MRCVHVHFPCLSPCHVSPCHAFIMWYHTQGIARDGPFPKPRCTDPIKPLYVLASVSPSNTSVAAAGVRSRPGSAAVTRDQIRDVLQPQTQHQQQALDSAPVRDALNISDIAGTRTMPLCSKEPVNNFKLDSSDIEGSWPGWKPPFR